MKTTVEQLERKQQELATHPDREKERKLVNLENQLKKDLATAEKESLPFTAAKSDGNWIEERDKYYTREELHVVGWEEFRDLVEEIIPIAALAKRKGYTAAESYLLSIELAPVRRAYLNHSSKGRVGRVNSKLRAVQQELRTLQRKMLGQPEIKSSTIQPLDPILDAAD